MLKRILIGMAMLLAASSMCGCATFMANRDVNAALKVATTVNVDNWHTATQDKMAIRDREAAKIEATFEQALAASTGGDAAVKILMQYRTKVAELNALRTADEAQYGTALNNATFMESLVDAKLALDARLDAFLGRFPAVSQLRTLAEAEVRNYMSKISKGAPQ